MIISLVSYLRISRETTPFFIIFLNFLSNQGFFITTTLSLKLVPQNLKGASWSCTLSLCNNILFILHSKIYLMWMDFGNSGFCFLEYSCFSVSFSIPLVLHLQVLCIHDVSFGITNSESFNLWYCLVLAKKNLLFQTSLLLCLKHYL